MGSFLQFLAFLSVTIVAVFLLADGDVMWRFMREFSLDSRDFRKGHELLFSHWYFSYPVLTVVVLIGQYLLLRAGDVFHDYYSQKNIGAFVTICLDRAESISRRETSLFESINDTYQKEAYQKNRWKLNQLIKEVCVSYKQQKECRVELEELVKESNHLAPYLDEVKQQLFTEKRDREEKFKKQLLEFDKELDQQGKMAFEEFQNKKRGSMKLRLMLVAKS